ncbi:hypothetical protein LTR94_035413, partial [Friedmanniomyces endolithicus]
MRLTLWNLEPAGETLMQIEPRSRTRDGIYSLAQDRGGFTGQALRIVGAEGAILDHASPKDSEESALGRASHNGIDARLEGYKGIRP